MIEIIPQVKRSQSRMNSPRDSVVAADSEFKKIRLLALDRDDKTCQGCGFKANSYQEVHHINNDHNDNRLENLVTVCVFCHNVFHLGFCGTKNLGTMILLPELSQVDLNNFVRVAGIAFSMKDSNEASKVWSRRCFELLELISYRARDLDQWLLPEFEGTDFYPPSDPISIGNLLLSLSDEDYERRMIWMKDIRYLPDFARYPRQIAAWSAEASKNTPPHSWDGIVDSLKGKVDRAKKRRDS